MFATGPVEDSTGTTHETAPDEEEEIDRRLRSVMKEIRPSKIIRRRTSTVSGLGNDKSGQDEDIPRPGSSYRFYRSESELPDAARAFYDAAAQLSGISVHTLVRAVFQAELRLQDWQEGKRRAEYHREQVDSETEEESGADKMDV
jgi:RNA polymerase I-specific transcription initiation factor RRN7